MRAAVAVAACAALLWASNARASCTRLSCFCLNDWEPRSATGTLDAAIVAVDGPRTRFTVEAVREAAGGFRAGDTLTLPREQGDRSGGRWLVFFVDGTVHTRMEIDPAGAVRCLGARDLVLPVQDAHDLFARRDCPDAIDARGFLQECADTVRCGCSASAAPLGAAVLLLLRVRRRPVHRRR